MTLILAVLAATVALRPTDAPAAPTVEYGEGQIRYAGHGARFWRAQYLRAVRGRSHARAYLTTRRRGFGRGVVRVGGRGPEAWHYRLLRHRLHNDPRAAIRWVFKGRASMAICIASEESGLRRYAVSPTGDYGLFQINRTAHSGWVDFGRIFDPLYNARVAYRLSRRGTAWGPWVVFQKGLCP